VTMLLSNNNIRRRARATLLRTNSINPRARDTRNSNSNNIPTARDHLPWARPRQWVPRRQCHRAGSSSGTRTASDGTMWSRRLGAHNGTLLLTYRLVHMRHRQQVRPTKHPVDITSALSLVTPRATKDTITHPLEPRPTRRRRAKTRRRARATPRLCSLLLVSVASRLAPGSATN
jgi:hypothetical protein